MKIESDMDFGNLLMIISLALLIILAALFTFLFLCSIIDPNSYAITMAILALAFTLLSIGWIITSYLEINVQKKK